MVVLFDTKPRGLRADVSFQSSQIFNPVFGDLQLLLYRLC